MKRKIVLKVVSHDMAVFHVRITKQTHRGIDFGNPSCDFTSSTGLMLSSCTCPEVYEEDDVLYVCGDNRQSDAQQFVVYNTAFMQRIMHAVREYNTYSFDDKLPDIPTGDTFIVD